jgi:flagellar biogenesis protein FliO
MIASVVNPKNSQKSASLAWVIFLKAPQITRAAPNETATSTYLLTLGGIATAIKLCFLLEWLVKKFCEENRGRLLLPTSI